MLPTDLPIPVVVIRHQCPHCLRTRAKKSTAITHIARCWRNPANRACKSCAHFTPDYSVIPDSDYPSPPEVWESPATCDADVDLPDREQMPVTNCPLWKQSAP